MSCIITWTIGHSWTDIAEMLGTTTKTLLQWRKRTNFQDLRLEFDPDVVDVLIRTLLIDQSKIGETQIIGHVTGNHDFKGTREQFRESIARADPAALTERASQFGHKIIRCEYTIKGPHKLWHLDGWHKLIRYRLVVFACVDGGTRTLIYASIRNNNRATNHMG